MKKFIFESALLIGLSISLVVCALAKEEQTDIANKLIRLHIVANSDSDADQILKLKVRDEVVRRVASITRDCKTKEESREIIAQNLDTLEEIANRVCEENGVSYKARAELGNARFPTKKYESFALPAGNYEALRINLGNASGENWWCVLFPPLCVSAAEAETTLEESGLSENEILLVTSDEPKYQLKFKLLEILGKF